MSLDRPSRRIIIAGASSLLGGEVKSLLEESRFAGWDLSLVDEDTAAGTLTEAGGEASIIQPVEEGTFSRAQLVFFTGSASFTRVNLPAARQSNAKIIDLSGASLSEQDTHVWFGSGAVSHTTDGGSNLYAIASAPALACGKLLSALGRIGLCRLAIVFFRPVSEAGRPGIEELESQTSQLLSFQSVGQPVFDSQVAFSMLDRYGGASRENLQAIRERIRREVSVAVGGDLVRPSIHVLHAPVFYGYTFVAIAELNSKHRKDDVAEACQNAGFSLDSDPSAPVGNVSDSNGSIVRLAIPESDAAQPASWWFWGAADNIRLPAATAVKLAEQLLK